MDGFGAVDFEFARQVLQRGIAALYVVAFALDAEPVPRRSWASTGCFPRRSCSNGRDRRSASAKLLRPTIFRYLRYTDRRLVALCAAGIVDRRALVRGIPQLGPPWVPMLCFLALWLGYMSIVSIGQTFYSFGWEMLLLEAGFLAAFLGSDAQPPATVVIVLLWWLVFRLEFGAGMIKIRGGREWRDLTALMFHHETQPMPGPLSRQAHLLPRWFHRVEVVGNHFAQLVVPWFLFAPLLGLWVPGPVPAIVGATAAAIVIATQLWLVAHGQLRLAELGDHRARVRRRSASRVSARARPRRGRRSTRLVDGIPLPWLIVTTAVGVLYLVAELAAAAQPVRAPSAHERELQPLAARRTRTARSARSRRSASRSSSRGRRMRTRMPQPGTSTGSRASRATCTGSPASSRRTTCASTG